MKTSDYTIYSIVAILLWIILRAVIIALILYFSWSAIIPNVFPIEQLFILFLQVFVLRLD